MKKKTEKGAFLKNKISNIIINNRKKIHIVFGVTLYFIINYFHISLLYVLIVGAITGIIFGKVFCRWMCPIGIFMEFILGMNPNENFKNMYQYHKMGCPIAWISGYLNKFSFFKIDINKKSCTNCGLCDDNCYLSKLEPKKYSLYKPKMADPGKDFKCSKCLVCVEKCPNGSLSYKFGIK